MQFHIMTLFPEMVMNGLHTSILGKAIEKELIGIQATDIRSYSTEKHGKVDDYTYGGGAGMLMQAQPVYDCHQALTEEIWNRTGTRKKIRTIYVTPQGETFKQETAMELSKEKDLIFLCGHYEGIDERVLEEVVTDYISIGDYVLTGGELPAMVMIDAIARLVPGVLNNEDSATTESFHNNLLEYPQYSRPEVWRGKQVPPILLSGNHAKISQWRVEQSEKRTRERRPDLYRAYAYQHKCIEWLLKKKIFHMDMIETLRRGKGEILYFEKDGVLLREHSGTFMLTTQSRESGEKILSLFEKNPWGVPEQLVSHQEFMNDVIRSRFDMKEDAACYQAVYTTKQMLPVPKDIDIRMLTEKDADVVAEHYHFLADKSYILNRIQSHTVYGIYEEQVLAGFVGTHIEGGMGMLEVMEPYRRKGYGRILESHQINQTIQRGETPYCQIICGNERSIALQRKLGFTISKDILYWFGK